MSVITDDVFSMEYDYTKKVIEHFDNPRNVGVISDADGVATIGSEECGDMIKVWIKVADEYLADVKYKVFGCPAAIAACSMMTELAIGKHIDQAWELTDDHVAEALGGLPAGKYHCSNLAASALHRAIMSYVTKNSVSSETATVTILLPLTVRAVEHCRSLSITSRADEDSPVDESKNNKGTSIRPANAEAASAPA